SLMGILNVITKDADDVDGVEVGGTLGGGPGDRDMGKAYVMYGDPDIANGRAKLFLHAGFETYEGPRLAMPSHQFPQPLPQPNSNIYEGPVTVAEPPRSYLWMLDGKLTIGKLQIRAEIPFADKHLGVGFPGDVVRQHLGEDRQTACAYNADPSTWFDPT